MFAVHAHACASPRVAEPLRLRRNGKPFRYEELAERFRSAVACALWGDFVHFDEPGAGCAVDTVQMHGVDARDQRDNQRGIA